MRVANWRGPEVFNDIYNAALANANAFMDGVVEEAKARCPVGTITREGKFVSANVSFTPSTGRNRGKSVSFGTQRRWTGRYPGQLRDTIRRVHKHGTGNIRVYAGNFKVYYAHMVERGTSKTPAHPFLRPTFNAKKQTALKSIKGK